MSKNAIPICSTHKMRQSLAYAVKAPEQAVLHQLALRIVQGGQIMSLIIEG